MDTVPTPTCPACGAAIPADAPQGLCPSCALGGAAAPTDALPVRGEPPSLDAVRAAFPQLEILGLLGAGGMGFVFQARQPHLDRLVALKLLPVPLAADPHFSERFLREGRLLARLTHPGIVSVHDFGEAGGFAYLLMEYVDGVNLRQAMAAGRFTPAEALAVVPKICEALQYAHGRGVLHRDIKPENLLLDAQGRVKIADFGIAKLVGDPARGGTLTGSGARLGTPHYMAPEQVESPGDVDHRADIYSLGVVFYEMLTGELPLGRFAPPSEKTPLDARVDQIVMRALAKERELRQQSAGEVQTQVEGLGCAGPAAEAQPGPAVPVLPARASRLAGWAVVGMALPQAVLAVVFLALVLPEAGWNPGREELLIALALWTGAPITLLSGLGLLRHGRTVRTEISRGNIAAFEGLGFVAGLLCLGALFGSSPHPAGLLALFVPPLAGLVLLIVAA